MKKWFVNILRVWRNEFRVVRADAGVLIFLFLLPFAYPLVYSAIYNPEVARDVSVVVVDDSRTSLTREYARHLDATQEISVVGYAANMSEARQAMAEKACYAVARFPHDFSQKVGRNEVATVEVYCDMSLLLRYKSVLVAVTAVAREMGQSIQVERIANLEGSSSSQNIKSPIPFALVPIGNVSQGLATAVMPGVLVLILQQCLLLAICFLGATSRERARANGGIDSMQVAGVGAFARLIGKALCYLVLIAVPAVFVLRFVPVIFDFPLNGNVLDLVVFFVPYFLAVIFFSIIMQRIVPDRESTFLVFVFSSVAFVFLSGVSWPRYAMSAFWQLVGDCIPSTWAINGFVEMNTAGATLLQQSEPYIALWILAIVYFVIAFMLEKINRHHNCRKW